MNFGSTNINHLPEFLSDKGINLFNIFAELIIN